MEPGAFTLAVLALLAVPGPTNTLLAAAGASGGFRESLPLIAAELAGYLLAILVLTLGLGGVVANNPALALGLKLAASLWLGWCAIGLWRQAGEGFAAIDRPVSFRRVFITTLLNPKALIFALVILPPGSGAALAAFATLVVLVATGWIGLGTALARSAGALMTPPRLWRGAALVLAAFATLLAGTAIAGSF